MAADEPVVHPNAPMPPGYCFVRKGNVYVTAHCRRATKAAGETIYVVARPSPTRRDAHVLGLRCPRAVYRAVCQAEAETHAARARATQKRDTALESAFRDALLARYPAVPPDSVPEIVQHAMVKNQRRVARTATLDLAERVRLAVRAHIRHCHTDYEQLLRRRVGSNDKKKKGSKEKKDTRSDIRALVMDVVDELERVWAGKAAEEQQTKESHIKPRTTTTRRATVGMETEQRRRPRARQGKRAKPRQGGTSSAEMPASNGR